MRNRAIVVSLAIVVASCTIAQLVCCAEFVREQQQHDRLASCPLRNLCGRASECREQPNRAIPPQRLILAGLKAVQPQRAISISSATTHPTRTSIPSPLLPVATKTVVLRI